MEPKTKKSLRERLKAPQLSPRLTRLLTLGLLLAATLGLHLLCQMLGTLDFSRGRFSSYFHAPTIFVLNLLPVMLLMTAFYFLTNRAWLAFLVPGVLLTVMEFVNYFKVALRGDPFTAEDFTLIGEATGILGEYTLVFPVWLFIAAALLLGGTLVLYRYARAKLPKRLWWVRVTAVVLCIGAAVGAWMQWYRDDALYEEQSNYYLFSEWKTAEKYASHGFVYSFLHSLRDLIHTAPEGYSKEAARALLDGFSDADIPEDKRVNLVVTMLESFSDLSALEGFSAAADAYAPLHALQAESFHGTLISDTVGGATINAERAFLTGFSYPQPRYRGATNSYVRYLASQGYRTDGSHPGYDWFYDRAIINANLGFERYLFSDNYYNELASGEHATDAELFPALAEIYGAQTADGTPYFSFSVTYQNHSPYDSDALNGTEYLPQGALSTEAYRQINNYLNGAADTCAQISAYVDTFRDNDEPVVLVFFGDHKPSFGVGNCDYEALGVEIAEGSPDGCRNLYSTPYLIWANDAAKAVLDFDFTGEGETISPCFLMSLVFDCCGWDGPAWMQYQRQMRETVPVLHCQTMFMENGVLTPSLSDAAQSTLHDYQIVEYYRRTNLDR